MKIKQTCVNTMYSLYCIVRLSNLICQCYAGQVAASANAQDGG